MFSFKNGIIRLLTISSCLLPGIVAAGQADFIKAEYPVTGIPDTHLDKFDREFVALMKRWHIPGASVAIMQNGKLVLNHGYGFSDIDRRMPVDPNAVFRIASVSKAITATAVLKLIEEGKLNFDDKVFDILSDLTPLPGYSVNPKIKDITVKNLLQMSSGFVAPGRGHIDPMFGPWSKEMANRMGGKENLPASCKDTTRMMMSMPLRAKPGTTYAYSNLDYCILGLLIDKTVGQPYDHRGYEHFVKTEILQPISVSNMVIGSTVSEHSQPREVRYYPYLGPGDTSDQSGSSYFPYAPTEMLAKNFSNGGWVASAVDLVKFATALGNGQIISQKMLNQMTARPSYQPKGASKYYTMGWKIKYVNGQPYWIATGSFTGTNAIVIRKPNGTTIAVVFNSRPPMYHMFRNFRPKLQQLFQVDNRDPQSQEIYALLEMIPTVV